jgi:hypothetical protein
MDNCAVSLVRRTMPGSWMNRYWELRKLFLKLRKLFLDKSDLFPKLFLWMEELFLSLKEIFMSRWLRFPKELYCS